MAVVQKSATKKYTHSGVKLTSKWTKTQDSEAVVLSTPMYDTAIVTFQLSGIPKNATITSKSCKYATTPNVMWDWTVPYVASSSSTSVSVSFAGKAKNAVTWATETSVSSPSIQLSVTYKYKVEQPDTGGDGDGTGDGAGGDDGKGKTKSNDGKFSHNKNQVAYIYDDEKKVTIVFDGVLSYEASSTVKMEEDTSNQKGYDYVNNALIQPNELTMKIMESDVYTNIDDVTKHLSTGAQPQMGSQGRARDMYLYLKELQEARRKVTVLTKYFAYSEMVLQSLAISVDETSQSGWSGSIGFRQYLVITKNKNKDGTTTSGSGSVSKDSQLFSLWGKIW